MFLRCPTNLYQVLLLIGLAINLPTVVAGQNESVLPELADKALSETMLGEQKDPQWIRRHAEGWFWRDVDPEAIEPEEAEEEIKPAMIDPNRLYPSMTAPLLDPIATLKALQKEVETSQARAVLQPTSENVLHFIRVQDELLKKNTLFADNWQRQVWRNPEYDYNQVRPHNPVALAEYNKSSNDARRVAMREIANNYGLYFIIAESCPYCHAMAPYLKRFSETYGFKVITVSIDGGTVDEFPDVMYSPEFADRLGVKTTPAVILANPRENVIEPISYGFVGLSELEKRIYRLFRLPEGQMLYKLSAQESITR